MIWHSNRKRLRVPSQCLPPPGKVVHFQASSISLEEIRQGTIKLSKPEVITGERKIFPEKGKTTAEITIKTRRLAKFPQRRYLVMEVDLHNPKQQIRHWLRRIIEHYWKRANPPDSVKRRGPSYDEFCLQVQKMEMEGQNIAEITRKLFPVETKGKTFSTDPIARSLYEKVRRASKKKILRNINKKED